MADASLPSPFTQKAVRTPGNAVTWNPLVGVVFIVSAFFLSQIIAALLTIGIFAASNSVLNTHLTFDDSVTANFILILFAELIGIGAVFGFVRGYGAKLSVIGFRKPRWIDLGYGLSAVPVYFVLYLLVLAAATQLVPGLNVDQKQELGFDNVHGTVALTLTFISLVILPPLAEEIMIRGFLYTSLKKAMKFVPAMILTSLIFAAAHLPEGGAAGPLYIAAIDTFVLSLVLVYLREKTESLWPGILLHAIKNGIAFVALFVIAK